MNFQYRVTPETIPNAGILYVDHQKNDRSGHLSHALVEYKKGTIMSFYSNCSGTRNTGHNGFGWLEYRSSSDGGLTWNDAKILPYSWDSFLNQPFTVSCETAVSTRENQIVAFCSRNTNPNGWEPYLEPTVVISEDGGESWGTPAIFCDKCGRIYDSMVVDGVIYVLFHAAPDWLAINSEHAYYIYRSDDNGKSFTLHGQLPGDPVNHAYGNMTLRDDGALICYTYNTKDEYRLTYCVSPDMGATWSETGESFCAKRIRNPQVAKVNGGYLLHGRSGMLTPELPSHLVLYTSADGIHWDEGVYLCEIEAPAAYYSNNIVMDRDGGQRVLIQSSVSYEFWDDGKTGKPKTNIAHWILDIE